MRSAVAAALAVAVVAGLVVAAQPLRSPWWTYADADATYTATGLNLLLGEQSRYLDHPGLPLQELIAVSFVPGWIASGDSRERYVDRLLLDLGRTRAVFRGWAAAFYVGGALVLFLVCSALLRGPLWGLAGGLLWVATPGLAAMSIQYRPDVLLAGLCALVAFLVVRAAQTRATRDYALAALALGVAITVKVHAAGLLLPLALAAVWRPPQERWQPRVPLPLIGAWLALAVVLNADRDRLALSPAQIACGVVVVALVAAAAWVRRPETTVAAALAAGVALPATLDLRDGLQSLVMIARALTGGGVNTGVEPFSAPLSLFTGSSLRGALLVFALAAAAAVVGALRRDPVPVLVFAGAAALALMGYARYADVHYFAPAFVVAVPAALWLLRLAGRAGPVLGALLVLGVALPAFLDRHAPTEHAAAVRAAAEPALRRADARLGEREVALTPSYYPVAGTRYFELVEIYVAHSPRYPYRFLPNSERARRFADARDLRVGVVVR